MRKLMAFALGVVLLLALAGCAASHIETTPFQNDPPTTVTGPTGGIGEIIQKPLASISVPTVTEDTAAANGTVIFRYIHQDISLILPDPDVANNVLQDLQSRIDGTKAAAELLRQQALKNYNGGTDWYPYQHQILFEPRRMDHSILSLFSSTVNYAGGAKAEQSYQGATYDLMNGQLLELLDIFSRDDWAATVAPLVTEALTAQKDDSYLYDDFAQTVQTRFAGDLSADVHWYFTQKGLCFFFPPYDIAPYASGVITAEIPYEKLTDILKPAYFLPERDSADGAISTQLLSDADMSKFSQISELTLDPDGIRLLLHTDSAVQDVRITVLSLAGKPNYTAFASYALTPGDAVMLQAPISPDEILTLSYVSGGVPVTETIVLPEASG